MAMILGKHGATASFEFCSLHLVLSAFYSVEKADVRPFFVLVVYFSLVTIFKAPLYPAMANESPLATPKFRRTTRPSLSIASSIPSKSSVPLGQIVPVDDSSYTTSMNQLDSNGYPTRALYCLHKRMLEVTLYREQYPNQPWWIRDDDQGTISPENSLDDEEIFSMLGEIHSVEDDLVLHNLCATLVSTEYVTPPTPPTGATPYDTPPEFEAPAFVAHDEYACRIARMVTFSGATDWQRRIVEACEDELDPMYANSRVLGDYPCGKVETRKTLLEEMQVCDSPIPREAKQARRRAKNSSKSVALEAIIESF
ncbi:unnamed protein product [Rhizoctonia solani]|uniref:Uncharacterized protein n=1 Tax=Rhizoctonia solani TaxID=456999 RepID=A0A8H2WS62_9AGAM|nr:unnamed protein product [Rhizoctonia solani]